MFSNRYVQNSYSKNFVRIWYTSHPPSWISHISSTYAFVWQIIQQMSSYNTQICFSSAFYFYLFSNLYFVCIVYLGESLWFYYYLFYRISKRTLKSGNGIWAVAKPESLALNIRTFCNIILFYLNNNDEKWKKKPSLYSNDGVQIIVIWRHKDNGL